MAIKILLAQPSQKVIYLTFQINYIKNNYICQHATVLFGRYIDK